MRELLLTGAFSYSSKQLKTLEELGYNITYVQEEREELDVDPSIFDAVVCNALFLYNDIEKFTNLKMIQLTSAGFDRAPMEYIKKNNIKISNARNVYSIPMAEWAILKVLEIYKKSRVFYKNQEKKKWQKERELFELTDKTVSIIGFGNVGKEIAKRFRTFGAKIIGVDIRKIDSNYIDEYYLINDFDKVIKRSDVIILTLPLTKETRKIIDKKIIDQMKNDVVLVNLARGGLIDESDLVQALEEDKFLGVALDVFEEEPLGESPLWNYNKVIITPHNSFVSDQTAKRLYRLIVKGLRNTK